MKKIKIAQIGVGHDHACEIVKSIKRQKDLFELVGYCAPDNEANDFKNNLQFFKDVREMTIEEILEYPGLDAVVIETEEKNLTQYATMACGRIPAVHMDKPGGMILEDFENLIKLAKENKTILHLGYMYRYNPLVIDTLNKIKKGEIGEVYSVEAQMNGRHNPQKRQWLEQFPGGMMFFLGCHLVDLILQIQGEPDEIIPFNTSTGFDGVNAKDYGMAIFKYKNGISFAKSCAEEIGGFQRRQLVVTGEKGTIEIKPLEEHAYEINPELVEISWTYSEMSEVYQKDCIPEKGWSDFRHKIRSEIYNRYDGMLSCFAEYVCGDKQNPYTYDYELLLYKCVLKACGVKF